MVLKIKRSNSPYIWGCLAVAALLCLAQVLANSILLPVCIAAFLLLCAYSAVAGFSTPVLLFFLPWSPLLKFSPGSITFYTLALILVCLICFARKGFAVNGYCAALALPIFGVTLIAKGLDGTFLSASYILFIFSLVLFPIVMSELREKVDFKELTVYFALGIVTSALSAQQLAGFETIARYIDVDSWDIITRYSGYYGDANFYSAHITAALAGVMLLLDEARGRLLYLLLILAVALMYCGFLSASKSFFVVIVCVVVLVILRFLRMRGNFTRKLLIFAGVSVVVAAIIASGIFDRQWQAILFRFDQATDISSLTTHRTEIWVSYLNALKNDPKLLLLGKGYNNVLVKDVASHNTLIQIVYQFGVIGLVFLVLWEYYFLRSTLRCARGKTGFLNAAVILCGVFLPWMAIDLMFFDEFFLMQLYASASLIYFANGSRKQTDITKLGAGWRIRVMNETYFEKNDEIRLDLKRLAGAVWSKKWRIAIAAVLCAALALAGTALFVTPVYQACATFYVSNVDSDSGKSGISASDITASRNLVDSCIVILKTRESLSAVIEYAGADLTASQLEDMISADSIDETEIFRVVVSSPDPEEAEKLAKAISEVLPQRLAGIIEGACAKTVEVTDAPDRPSAPNYTGCTVLGFLLGLILSVGTVVLRDIFDGTIRTEADVTRITQYPVLASVPDMSAGCKKKYPVSPADSEQPVTVGGGVSFAAAEAYKRLRAKLLFSLDGVGDCPVIGVSSSLSGEGKSLSAINLAYTLSQLGKKVVLIDCDMRRPTLAEKLGIVREPGLSEYLSGQSGLEGLIRYCGIPGEEAAFQVIPAGQNPPNPTELLSSAAMAGMLRAMRKSCDYVILALPPLGEVSDAMAVAKETDGMLLVVRHNYCNRAILSDTIQQLEFIEAKILGIVCNCVTETTGQHGKNGEGCHNRDHGREQAGTADGKSKAQMGS